MQILNLQFISRFSKKSCLNPYAYVFVVLFHLFTAAGTKYTKQNWNEQVLYGSKDQ